MTYKLSRLMSTATAGYGVFALAQPAHLGDGAAAAHEHRRGVASERERHLDAAPGLVNEHDGWAPRLAERPVTKYEARGLAAGRRVYDLTYRRVDAAQA